MITRGLSCDRIEFGHFGVGWGCQMTSPPRLRACRMRKLNCNDLQKLQQSAQNAEFSPEEMRLYKREFQCQGGKL